ncbi:MAG: hypothetical protein ACLSXC_10160 [Beduini sp.]
MSWALRGFLHQEIQVFLDSQTNSSYSLLLFAKCNDSDDSYDIFDIVIII